MTEYMQTDLFRYLILPIIYILIGCGIYRILKSIINKIFTPSKGKVRQKKRLNTIRIIIENFLKYIIMIIVILIILTTYNVDVQSIIAGLGIGVAVVGLAFQDVLKDILAGISILLEDQFEVGDEIEVSGFRGQVTFIGLKTTRIKNFKGAVKIVSNRNITEVINYSINPALALIELPVRYESDLEELEKTLTKIAKNLEKKYEGLKGPIEILGVERLDDSSVTYRIAVLTEAGKQFQIERNLKKDYKIGIEKAGFSIPYPQLEVHYER